MGSTFSSYQIARTGMYVSERGLYTTGHNISNVNTAGYSRQQTIIAETAPSSIGRFLVGIGADVQQTRQVRSQFLDNTYRQQSELFGYAEARSSVVEEIETILPEPSNTSLSSVIDKFFKSWEELSKDPGSLTVRASVRQRSIEFVDMVNHIGDQLNRLQNDTNMEIKNTIGDINSTAKQIAELNQKIMKVEGSGDQANDFRDERNLLLDDLSQMINIDISEKANGTVDVAIGGIYLVNGLKTNAIKADYNSNQSIFYTAKWENNDAFVQVRGGRLKGLIEARGDVDGYKGSVGNGSPVEGTDVNTDAALPGYKFNPSTENIISELRNGINIMVNLMTRKVNELHSGGVGLDGSSGVELFTKIDESLPLEMSNIQVNPLFNDDNGLNKIAASATGAGKNDNQVAQEIADLRSLKFFQDGNVTVDIDTYYSGIVSWVGAVGQEAGGLSDNQYTLLVQLQNNRDSLSGVSLDEEMTNMMKYQHAYNASARVINIVDEMIDQIVNRMGIVGR
ncbi:MAG: flagellar hook-associated protein FlgK [Clostridia bacterium]